MISIFLPIIIIIVFFSLLSYFKSNLVWKKISVFVSSIAAIFFIVVSFTTDSFNINTLLLAFVFIFNSFLLYKKYLQKTKTY